MSGLLGMLLLIVFIVVVIAFSAAVTWVVVKVSPTRAGRQRRREGSAPAP